MFHTSMPAPHFFNQLVIEFLNLSDYPPETCNQKSKGKREDETRPRQTIYGTPYPSLS